MKLPERKIIGLMACDPRGVIGKNGGLPWNYPQELEHFRQTVFGQIMVMGRQTFEALSPNIAETAFNVIFSKTPLPSNKDNIVYVKSLQEFLQLDNLQKDRQIFMIGGAEIAKLFMEAGLVKEFLLTRISKHYDGDAVLPLKLLDNWQSVLIEDKKDYRIYKLSR